MEVKTSLGSGLSAEPCNGTDLSYSYSAQKAPTQKINTFWNTADSAVCTVQHTVCNKQCAIYSVQYTACNIQCAIYRVQHAVCNTQ